MVNCPVPRPTRSLRFAKVTDPRLGVAARDALPLRLQIHAVLLTGAGEPERFRHLELTTNIPRQLEIVDQIKLLRRRADAQVKIGQIDPDDAG